MLRWGHASKKLSSQAPIELKPSSRGLRDIMGEQFVRICPSRNALDRKLSNDFCGSAGVGMVLAGGAGCLVEVWSDYLKH